MELREICRKETPVCDAYVVHTVDSCVESQRVFQITTI